MTAAGAPRDKVLESLQRKANILAELYEMSKALGSGFDLDKIFKKATDIIFRSTPADRVIALLAEGIVTEQNADEAKLFPIATRARDEKLEAHARKMTIGRTITRKVMKDKVALLSQDAVGRVPDLLGVEPGRVVWAPNGFDPQAFDRRPGQEWRTIRRHGNQVCDLMLHAERERGAVVDDQRHAPGIRAQDVG